MYPIMVNIQGKKVVIVGGGVVATRKLHKLLEEGAEVTIISPSLCSDISPQEVHWINRCYRTGDLEGATLVFACTNQADVNQQVLQDALASQLVNNTGDKYHSDFYNVAIAKKKDVSIMISTNGFSPSRAKEVRKKIEELLDQL